MKKSKTISFAIMITICFVVAKSNQLKSHTIGKFWAGVSYAMSENGYSNKEVAGITVFGVFHSAMEGVVWGMVAGPAGMAAGIVSGL